MRRVLCGVVVLLLWIAPALADSQTLYAAVSSGSTLNVRDKPVTGEVLYTLTRGDAVMVTDSRNGWAYVELAGDYGWACMDYLHIVIEFLFSAIN